MKNNCSSIGPLKLRVGFGRATCPCAVRTDFLGSLHANTQIGALRAPPHFLAILLAKIKWTPAPGEYELFSTLDPMVKFTSAVLPFLS